MRLHTNTVELENSMREPPPDSAERVIITLITLFVCFWLAVVASGIGLQVLSAIRQHRARQFPTTVGRVTLSSVEKEWVQPKDKTKPPRAYYRPEVQYQYELDGKVYRGSRSRYDDRKQSDSDPELAARRAAAHPKGSEVTVFYNPRDPEDALLEPGLAPRDLFFFPGFAFVAFGLLALRFVGSWWRDNFIRPDTGGVRVIKQGILVRARLPRYSPFMLGLLTAFVLSLAIGFFKDENSAHPASFRDIAYGWAVVLVGSGIVLVGLNLRLASGVDDLVIDREANTLTLPRTFGRRRTVTVPIPRVVSAELVEQGKGRNYQCHPTLFFSDPVIKTARLGNWMDQRKGRAFIRWLRVRIWF
jgi:hypothetical protein